VLGSLEDIYESIRLHVSKVNAALTAMRGAAVSVKGRSAPGARWGIIRGYISARSREPYKWGL
jgi:hypothetical protein